MIGDDDLEEFGLGYEVREGAGAIPQAPTAAPKDQAAAPRGFGPSVADPDDISQFGHPEDLARSRATLLELQDNLVNLRNRNAPAVRPAARPRTASLITFSTDNPIAPGDTVQLQGTAYESMAVESALVTETVPGSCEVTRMFVGAVSALPHLITGIPAAHFAAMVSAIGLPTVHVAILTTIEIRNAGSQPCKITITLFGRSPP